MCVCMYMFVSEGCWRERQSHLPILRTRSTPWGLQLSTRFFRSARARGVRQENVTPRRFSAGQQASGIPLKNIIWERCRSPSLMNLLNVITLSVLNGVTFCSSITEFESDETLKRVTTTSTKTVFVKKPSSRKINVEEGYFNHILK